MPNFHRVLHVQKREKQLSCDFRKAQIILSVEKFVEIKLSRLPLEVKLTFKSAVLAKIALNMAYVYDVLGTSWGAFPKYLNP